MSIDTSKLNAAKSEKYGNPKVALPTDWQAIFEDTTNINSDDVLTEVKDLLNNVYYWTKQKDSNSSFDQSVYSKLVKARWAPDTDKGRKAYNAINKVKVNGNPAFREAIHNMRKAWTDLNTAKSWAQSHFTVQKDKDVFNDTNLTTPEHIRNTANLLNYITWAETGTGTSHTLTRLKSFRDHGDKVAWNAVNKTDTRGDKAITKLEGGGGDDNKGEIERVQNDIRTIGVAIKSIEKIKDEKQTRLNRIKASWAESKRKARNAQKKIDSVKDLKERLTGLQEDGTVSTKNRIIVNDANLTTAGFAPPTDRITGLTLGTNDHDVTTYLRNINRISSDPKAFTNEHVSWKTNITDTFLLRNIGENWTNKLKAISFNCQVFDFMRRIDLRNMIDAINDSSNISGGTVTVNTENEITSTDDGGNKYRAISLWNKLYKTSWKKIFDDKTSDLVLRNNVYYNEYLKEDGSKHYLGSQTPDDNWPLNYFDHEEFFDFMRIVFPRTNSAGTSGGGNGSFNNSFFSLFPSDQKIDIYLPLFSHNVSSNAKPGEFIHATVQRLHPNKISEFEGYKILDQKTPKHMLDLFYSFYTTAIIPDTNVSSETYTAWSNRWSGSELNVVTAREELKFVKEVLKHYKNIDEKYLAGITRENISYYHYLRYKALFGKEPTDDEMKKKENIYHVNVISGNRKLYHLLTDKTFTLNRTKFEQNSGTTTEYLYVESLDEAVSDYELERDLAEANAKADEEAMGLVSNEIHELDRQIAEKKEEENNLKKALNDLKNKSLEELEQDFRSKYRASPHKYTLTDISIIRGLLAYIKVECGKQTPAKSFPFETEETEFLGRYNSAEYTGAESRISAIKDIAGTAKEKVKKHSITALNDLKNDFDLLESKYRIISQVEKELYQAMVNKISGRDDDPGSPQPQKTELKIEELQSVLGKNITVDQALVNKWKNIASTKIDKNTVKRIFNEVGADNEAGKKTTDFTKFIDHVKTKNISESTEEATFQKLLTSKSAQEVVEMIIEHKLETADWKKKYETALAGKIDTLKKEDYTGDAGLKKYIFEELIGKPHTLKPSQTPQNGDPGKKDGFWRLNSPWMWVTVIGIPLVLIGLASVIWWDKLKGWWSGEKTEEGTDEENKDTGE